jgi:predicted ATP-grasp superfamily ATP-dependent carboligase
MSGRVLVIGGPTKAAIGLMRALHAEGDVCDLAWRGTRRDEILLTRAARRFIRVSRTSAPDLDAFGATLLDLATGGGYDVVIPMGDWETWLVVTHAARLEAHVGLLVPRVDAHELANDKGAVMAHAADLGIATPRVWDWPDAPDPGSLPTDLRFPVVVKARAGSGVDRGLRFAADPDQLSRAYIEVSSTEARLPTEDFTRPLIMEFVPGFVHDASAVAHDGVVVNVVTNVRQLMLPIEGGGSAVTITTHEPALAELARTLLESLAWNGPADVECKYDPRDGRYKLLEVNPRFWGNLDVDLQAGMNFPAQVRDLALGREVVRDQGYEVGLRYVFAARAASAYLQLANTHGIGALRDRRRYPTTTFGLTARDPRPASRELAATARSAARQLRALAPRRRATGTGPRSPSPGSLPRDLVNTLDRTGDPGF